MKHLKKIIFTLIVLIGVPITTHAASGTISVSSSSSAVVGNTITVTVRLSSSSALGSWDMDLSYNSSYLRLTSSSAENGGTYMVGYASNGSTYSKTYTFQFQVLKSGSTTVGVNSYLVYGFDESEMSISSSTKTIRLMTQAELEATYSSDNNLKALSIDDYELTPAFNTDTLEYTVTVPSEVTKIKINATKNDSTATVSGDGEHEVNEGSNVFEIKVQAQNGSTKIYKITVNVEDANPINITTDNTSYTIVKRRDNIEAPSSYTETTITIDDVEIPAYYSEASGLTLIGIKDEEGNVYLAIYYADENRYEIYNENKSDQLTLYIKDIPEEKEGFIKSTVTINDITYDYLKLNDTSNFILIYAMDIVTGEEDYYIYDKENNSYVLYNDELMNMYVTETEKYKQVILYGGIGAVVVIFILLIICMRKPKRQKKKKITPESKEEKEVRIEKINVQKQKQDEEELAKEIEEKLNKKESTKASKNTTNNKSKTKKKETTPKTNTEVLNKVNEATQIIEDFEKTTALNKEDLKEVKEQSSKTTEELEATMYDLFKEDKPKKRKKKKR